MSAELGHLGLMLAWLAALLQAAAGLGWLPGGTSTAGRVAPLALGWQAAGVAGALLGLGHTMASSDFSLVYAVQHSHSLMPLAYKVGAVWGGHEGSMLLWCGVLALWSVAAYGVLRRRDAAYALRVAGILGVVAACMLAFVLFTSNPFLRLLPAADEGRGLNPLLQDPGLVLHPPLLYLGYVGSAVPFAMTMAALMAPAPAGWLRWMQPFTASAMALLGVGIALGSWWAYYELGWGGWWFWDPVENASLMPWLALAALLHANVVAERRGRLVAWVAVLSVGSFALALLGTFLVRSGVLTSVHAFASDARRGVFMLAMVTLAIGAALALAARGHGQLTAPAAQRAAPRSREGALAAGVLLLAVLCASVMLGTLYPLALDALGLDKLSVGAPWFEAMALPIGLAMLALLAWTLGLGWGLASARAGGWPLPWKAAVAATAVGGPLLAWLLLQRFGALRPAVLAGTTLALAVAASTLASAWERRRRNGRIDLRFGGMVTAHLGLAVFAAGVAVVGGHGVERDVRMEPGRTQAVDGCTIALERIRSLRGPNYDALAGDFTLACPGRAPAALRAEKRNYIGSAMPMTESAIDVTFWRDLYVALGEPLTSNPHGAWSVRLQSKPMVRWVWVGVLGMAVGGLMGAWALRPRRVGVGVERSSATSALPVPGPEAAR